MEIELIQMANSTNAEMRIFLLRKAIDEFTYEAMMEMSREVGKKIASSIFKENKKKIMDGVNLDLVIAEVEKKLLEKIKANPIKK